MITKTCPKARGPWTGDDSRVICERSAALEADHKGCDSLRFLAGGDGRDPGP